MLRRMLQALWGPPPPLPPRMRDLLERQDALEGDVAGLRKRVKALEGQISGGMRSNTGVKEREDAPGATDPDIEYPPRR
ncbi:MAG: hypothetical protein ACREXU_02830, partial [Gammaproteobacteria bacterium]